MSDEEKPKPARSVLRPPAPRQPSNEDLAIVAAAFERVAGVLAEVDRERIHQETALEKAQLEQVDRQLARNHEIAKPKLYATIGFAAAMVGAALYLVLKGEVQTAITVFGLVGAAFGGYGVAKRQRSSADDD